MTRPVFEMQVQEIETRHRLIPNSRRRLPIPQRKGKTIPVWHILKEHSFANLGIARWRPFDHRAGGIRYVLKYLWKHREDDNWDVYTKE